MITWLQVVYFLKFFFPEYYLFLSRGSTWDYWGQRVLQGKVFGLFFYKCNLCFSLLYLILSTHLCSTLLFAPQCTLLFHCSADILLVSILVCSALNYHNTLYLFLLYSINFSPFYFLVPIYCPLLFSLLLSTLYCILIPSPLVPLLSSPLINFSLLYPSLPPFPTCFSLHFSPPFSCPLL